MNDETMKILKMLEEGKLNAADAARLLDAIGVRPGAGGVEGAVGASGVSGALGGQDARAGGPSAKSIHVRVFKEGSDRARVNVHVPLSLAKWALKFGGKHAQAHIGNKDMDWDELNAFLEQPPGEILTVQDDDSGERVEITLK